MPESSVPSPENWALIARAACWLFGLAAAALTVLVALCLAINFKRREDAWERVPDRPGRDQT